MTKTNNEINKPNGVLFKREDGQLIMAIRKNGDWCWDGVLFLDGDGIANKYDDLSAKDPFEFVFIHWNETGFTTVNQKTIIPNESMTKLFDEDRLKLIIEADYENQYGYNSV